MSSTVLLCAASTVAQQNGMIEGVVLNSITGRGVEGVEVTMYTQDAVRYTVTTDAAGGFRVSNVASGTYYARTEKAGYYEGQRRETGYVVGQGHETPRPRLWITHDVAVRGRVVDVRGEPVENVVIRLLGGGAKSGADGTFQMEAVPPGVYTFRATPQPTGEPVQSVPTYSQRLVVRDEDIERFEIRLPESEVFRMSGVVLGATGEPVARARVMLNPIVQREPQASGSPLLSFSAAYRGITQAEAIRITDDRGRFEFFPVYPGDWFVQAETSSIDSRGVAGDFRAGGEHVRVGRGNLEDVRLRLLEPFPFTARGVRIEPVSGNGLNAMPQLSGRAMLPGTYYLRPGPQPGRHASAILLDGRDVTGQPVALIDSSQEIEVKYRDARGHVQGRVNGEAGSVVLIPSKTDGSTFGYVAPVEEDGAFSITGVAPGDYIAAAINGHDRLRPLTLHAELLQRIVSLGTRVSMAEDGTSTIEIHPMQWPE